MKSNKEVAKNEEDKKDKMFTSSYCELPNDEDSTPTKTAKKESRRSSKDLKESWGFRKSKAQKEKSTDPERFIGDGINFKAKIIGIENVFNARGNRMCQDALQKLKASVKTSGEHKHRILLNISLLGIRIKDEKTGEVLHHHPVHKISFISQDVGDNRAFGYVFGCPQSGHQFFGIKTEKTAAQVVCTLRDLFHTALKLKKLEMEKALEHQKEIDDGDTSCNSVNGQKTNGLATSDVASENDLECMTENLYSELASVNGDSSSKSKDSPSSDSAVGFGCTVDNLLDLQFEMDSLQQGITQMEYSISSAASLGFGVSFSEDDNSISSGCSFPMTPRKLNRISAAHHETLSASSRSSSTSDYAAFGQDGRTENFAVFKNDNVPAHSLTPPPLPELPQPQPVEDRYAVFNDIDAIPSVFDNPISSDTAECDNTIEKLSSFQPTSNGNSSPVMEDDNLSDDAKATLPVPFAELDPLGCQPYVEKEKFFSDIKNPPKKVLKDLMGVSCDTVVPPFESDRLIRAQYGNVSDLSTVQENYNPFASSVGAAPPRLPPKRALTVAASSIPSAAPLDDITFNRTARNPFNPFVVSTNEEVVPDTPPPTSPPPPPPRFPSKDSEMPGSTSPPPPRPPSRDSAAPTPPRPRRKVPIGTASCNWFSFDQEVINSHSAHTLPSVWAEGSSSPPIPNPLRKRPGTNSADTFTQKSNSTSNSPSMSRRHSNVQTCFLDNKCAVNGSVSPGRRMLSRHTSVNHESWGNKPMLQNSLNGNINLFGNSFQVPSVKDCAEVKNILSRSPPLPPKATGISRPRPSPSRKMLSAPSSSSQTTSNSSSSSNSSSAQYSSLDETKSHTDSLSEALCRSSGDSQVNDASSGYNGDMSSVEADSSQEEKLSPTSPDSIFRRKDDPFADDFFLTLPKKSSITQPPIKEDCSENCTNGFESDFISTKMFNCSEDMIQNKSM